jgi:hypothetical protein
MNKTVGIIVAIAAVAAIGSMLTVHFANALTGNAPFELGSVNGVGGAAQANGFGCAGGPGLGATQANGFPGFGGLGTGGSSTFAGNGADSSC